MAFSEPISSHVTFCHFGTLCPMCCLQKVDKLYHETEEGFLLYMAFVAFNYIKGGRKCQKLQF